MLPNNKVFLIYSIRGELVRAIQREREEEDSKKLEDWTNELEESRRKARLPAGLRCLLSPACMPRDVALFHAHLMFTTWLNCGTGRCLLGQDRRDVSLSAATSRVLNHLAKSQEMPGIAYRRIPEPKMERPWLTASRVDGATGYCKLVQHNTTGVQALCRCHSRAATAILFVQPGSLGVGV